MTEPCNAPTYEELEKQNYALRDKLETFKVKHAMFTELVAMVERLNASIKVGPICFSLCDKADALVAKAQQDPR